MTTLIQKDADVNEIEGKSFIKLNPKTFNLYPEIIKVAYLALWHISNKGRRTVGHLPWVHCTNLEPREVNHYDVYYRGTSSYGK